MTNHILFLNHKYKNLYLIQIKKKLMTKTIIEQLKTITETIEDLIEKETTTWYPNRELPGSSLTDLEEVYELLENIVNYEPTDQQMLSSFGTKWHDGL